MTIGSENTYIRLHAPLPPADLLEHGSGLLPNSVDYCDVIEIGSGKRSA
jgi:hypothetical protein